MSNIVYESKGKEFHFKSINYRYHSLLYWYILFSLKSGILNFNAPTDEYRYIMVLETPERLNI